MVLFVHFMAYSNKGLMVILIQFKDSLTKIFSKAAKSLLQT